MNRSSLLMLALGLLTGVVIGYVAGRWRSTPEAPAPVGSAPPPAVPPAPAQVAFSGLGLPGMTPTEVSKGMSRARAVALLGAEGFEPWTDASVSDQWERFRKPWQGGYHYVSLRSGGGEVAEVGESWIDP